MSEGEVDNFQIKDLVNLLQEKCKKKNRKIENLLNLVIEYNIQASTIVYLSHSKQLLILQGSDMQNKQFIILIAYKIQENQQLYSFLTQTNNNQQCSNLHFGKYEIYLIESKYYFDHIEQSLQDFTTQISEEYYLIDSIVSIENYLNSKYLQKSILHLNIRIDFEIYNAEVHLLSEAIKSCPQISKLSINIECNHLNAKLTQILAESIGQCKKLSTLNLQLSSNDEMNKEGGLAVANAISSLNLNKIHIELAGCSLGSAYDNIALSLIKNKNLYTLYYDLTYNLEVVGYYMLLIDEKILRDHYSKLYKRKLYKLVTFGMD